MGLCTRSSSSHSRTTILILSTEVISHSVQRTIVLVGYGTGIVPGTNGLQYEYDTFRTSVHEYAQFSIENVLLPVALRTCTPYLVPGMQEGASGMYDQCSRMWNVRGAGAIQDLR